MLEIEKNEEFLKVQDKTVSHMKDLLKEIKVYKHIQLEQKIKELEKELKEIKKAKKYGLVWEEKQEFFDKETVGKLPVLEEIKEKSINQNDTENNILIEGDNYHTLSVLNYTHAGKIDVIYIDPPYNTGKNDFIYNDKIVDKEDNFRHSKWLSFMNKRLKLAKNLLNQNGIIFISIDDNELFSLKLLCDEIFGYENYIGTLSIENNPKGRKNSNFISINNEYCLIFGKDKNNEKTKFIENIPKDRNSLKIDEFGRFFTSGKRVLIGESTNNLIEDYNSNKHYIVYYNKKLHNIIIKNEKTIIEFDKNLIDKGYKRYISSKNNLFIENTYSKNEFEKLFINNSLIFKENTIYEKDFNQNIRMKSLLINNINKGIDLKTETANKQLKELGINFSNPKNYKYIILLLSLFENKSLTILDFFAGSGTTAQAVLELNKKDGGNRKFILATNNENNICEKITYKRIKNIIKGYKKYDGLGGNLTYLKTDFIDKSNVNDDLRVRMVNRCTELLCLKENIWNEIKQNNNKIKIFERHNKYLAILYDMFYFDEFKETLKTLRKPISIFVFSHYKLIKRDFFDLNNEFEIEQIPDPILEVYESIFGL